jgi:hypothetical protein
MDDIEKQLKKLQDRLIEMAKSKTNHQTSKRSKRSKRSKKQGENLLDEAKANWGGGTGGNAYVRQCLGKRYQVIREVLYYQLPQWKKNVVDSDPNGRISTELASDVCRTTEHFDYYLELVNGLSENPVSEELRSSLITLTDEARRDIAW